MPGLDAPGAMEGEVLVLGAAPSGDRLEHERLVVAGVDARKHAPDEPVAAAVEDRDPTGLLVPVDQRELVDLVAGRATEQLREVAGVGRHGMDAEQLGIAAMAPGAVAARKAHQEAMRIDAR